MLPRVYSPNANGSLFPSQNENTSIFGNVDHIFNTNLDVNQPLRPYCPQQNTSNDLNFGSEDRSKTNLIINYLPQSFDQNDLQRLFERIGPIRQCKLIRDKVSKLSNITSM